MISAEFIVNVGAYQHVKVTVSAMDKEKFLAHLDNLDDDMKARLGEFQAELESWIKTAHEKALSGPVEMLETGLGATVVGVTERPVEPGLTDFELAMAAAYGPGDIQGKALAEMDVRQKRPWDRKLEAPEKPWQQQAPKPAALDDF